MGGLKSILSSWNRLRWIGIFFLVGLSQLNFISFLFKFGKIILTMGLTVYSYAILYPWWFALGLVVMAFIHEMGHIWVAKRKNIPVSAPAFIPYLGGLITMKKMPQDAVTEAYIAYGGPLLGTIGALVSYGLGTLTSMKVFYAVALVGFLINLFHLIPIRPLDGRRIVVAVFRRVWIVGVIIAIVLFTFTQSFFLLVVLGWFLYDMWVKERNREENKMKMQVIPYRAKVPTSLFTDSNRIIPGENYRRPLPFTRYCPIDTREEWIDIFYPGAGRIAHLKANQFNGEFHQVELLHTKRGNDQLIMFLAIHLTAADIEQEQCFNVAPMIRLKFGLAYFGLAIFLVMMTGVSFMAIGKLPFN